MPRPPGSPAAEDPDPTDDWVCIHIEDEAKKATSTVTEPDDIQKSLQTMRQRERVSACERKASAEYIQAEAVANQEIEEIGRLLHNILPPQPAEDHDRDSDDNFRLEMPLATSPKNDTTASSSPPSPHFSYQSPAHGHDLADLPRLPAVNTEHSLTISSPSTPYRRFSSKPPTTDGDEAIHVSIQPMANTKSHTAVNRLSTLSHHSSSQLAMKPPPKCSDLFFKAAVGVTVTAAVVAIAKSLG
ncbi:hypothetical protein [Piscirickettsia salmonis]|uniref:hypothetical protein n=1 Tax=Piscirickettsia salmonis TaxID=1238 RepID=UPI0007C8DA28|nr:hypothetical protein A0O36_02552 [Piscirickettsiaceae bacterium NZ-RLO1]